jgi:hypothetical protein
MLHLIAECAWENPNAVGPAGQASGRPITREEEPRTCADLDLRPLGSATFFYVETRFNVTSSIDSNR